MNDMQKFTLNENDRILWINIEIFHINGSLKKFMKSEIEFMKLIITENNILLTKNENNILLIKNEIFMTNFYLINYLNNLKQ